MEMKDIKELIRVFDKSGLTKLDVENGDFAISMDKNVAGSLVSTVAPAPVAQVVPASVPVVASETASSDTQVKLGDTINAPMVGTFYSSPSPEAPDFVKVGDTIKKGQTLCILEAMKIMNEVEAEFDCKIKSILINDASPVEYDMPMFEVEKI